MTQKRAKPQPSEPAVPKGLVNLSTYTTREVAIEVRVLAARSGKKVWEIVTEALQQYLKGKDTK